MMGKKFKKMAGSAVTPVSGQAPTPSRKGLISDTTCTGLTGTTWQGTYNLLEGEQPEVTVTEASADELRKSEATLKDLADSFLHRIAAREQVLPYTDIVRWAIEEIPLTNRTFITKDGRIFGSFRPEDLRQMYHLPNPEQVYNSAFVEKFAKENESPSEPLREWRQNPAKHKHDMSGKYSNASLASPYCYAGIMMCRLWGLHDSANIHVDMIPLMEAAVNSIIMNWATILSDKLVIAIREFRAKTRVSERKIPPFYYSAYIMDALCFNSEFPVLGWRWTTHDPTPIHLYHRKLWKPSHKDHLYQICNGFMVPVHYSIFDRPIPRISYEASFDLPAVAHWFGEEYFSYIRVFGSKARPHVLPIYMPDKLIAREISYQIMSEGVTQTLKDKSKRGWPSFPLRIGVFTLLNYKHAEKEAAKLQKLSLVSIPNRLYDPNKTAFTALEQAKLTKVVHQEDQFDDLFMGAESLSQATQLAAMRYGDRELTEFNKLRKQRLQTLPLSLLSTTPTSSSSEPDQPEINSPPVSIREQEENQRKLQAEEQRQREIEEQRKREIEEQRQREIEEKRKRDEDRQKKEFQEQQQRIQEQQQREALEQQQRIAKEKEQMKQLPVDTELIKEWNQFDSIINSAEAPKDSDVLKTPDTTISSVLERTSGPPTVQNSEEVIQNPSDIVDLQVEEIPPLDIFYSPKHKAVVRRSRKRRRLDQLSASDEQTVTGNVVWKGELSPSEDLTKLSQFAGAYSAATIDKASEVSLLLKAKEHEVYTLQAEVIEARNKATQAEEQLLGQQQENHMLTKQIEQLKIDQSDIRTRELAEALSELEASNELLIKSKEDQIAQLTAQLEDFKGAKNIQDFRAEATLINRALISSTRLLCRQLVEAESLCDITAEVRQQIEQARTNLDQAEEDIIEYIKWQDTPEGQAANFARISVNCKNILFLEWETQVMKAEVAVSRCKTISKSIINLVNDTLYLANMISQCTPGNLTTANELEQNNYPKLEEQWRLITGVNTLTTDAYWLFLIKPHSQRSALNCLTDSLRYLIADFKDATYDAQLTYRLNTPPEVEPMLAICQRKSKGKKTAD